MRGDPLDVTHGRDVENGAYFGYFGTSVSTLTSGDCH